MEFSVKDCDEEDEVEEEEGNVGANKASVTCYPWRDFHEDDFLPEEGKRSKSLMIKKNFPVIAIH